MVKSFGILILFSLVIHPIRGVSIPKIASLSPRTDSDVPTDWQSFAQNLLGTRAGRRTNKLDIESPSARAALAYLKSNLVEDNLCAEVAQTYISTIISGGSPAEANAIAAGVYVRNYKAGVRSAPGSPCEAADIAFRKAVADGDDPVMSSALAFMNTYKSESPCFASARDYVKAIANGETHIHANFKAVESFTNQIQKLASQGKSTIDPTCAEAALSYASSSQLPSSPSAAAMKAFISKSLETGMGYDPTCNKAAEAFFHGFHTGRELAATFEAAKEFISYYLTNPISASRSPCAAAAKAYASAVERSPSPENREALFAFIDEAMFSDDDGLDPVCGSAAQAYFNTYIATGREEDAIEAAGVAYIEALDANPDFDIESPCGKAAQAYISQL